MAEQNLTVKQPWEIFEIKRSLRSNEILTANDLSDYPLSDAEKDLACRAVDGKLTEGDEMNWWNNIGLDTKSYYVKKEFCNLFGIPIGTFLNWFNRNYKGNKFAHEKSGPPRKIDDSTMKSLCHHLLTSAVKPDDIVFNDLLLEAQKTTAKKRRVSINDQASIEDLCIASKKMYTKEYGLKDKKCQKSTEAREKALADKRLRAHWITVLLAVMGNLPAYKKFNSDDSMVGVMAEGSLCRVWVATRQEVEKHDREVTSNPTNVFYYKLLFYYYSINYFKYLILFY